jgi:hypothetical protein
MPLPLYLNDRVVLDEVPLSLWTALFDAVGWPSSLTLAKEDVTHAQIADAFEKDSLHEEHQVLLDALHYLGTSEGAEFIQQVLQEQRVAFDQLPAGSSARELAAHLFLAQRTDRRLADVFKRAQLLVHALNVPQKYHEFLNTKAGRFPSQLITARELEADVRAYCIERDLGDHVQIWPTEDGGVYVFQIIYSHRIRKPVVVPLGQTTRATIKFRPVYSDQVEFDSTLGRLRIATRSPSMVPYYRRTMGRLLFGDEEAFSGDAVCTLRPLQQGRRALDHAEPGIGRVWMTECVWERGDRGQVQLRDIDCFDQIEELKLPLSEGRLVSAKLKIQVAGSSTRPATVTIRVPTRIEINPQYHEVAINKLLTRLGIRGQDRADTVPTLWTLSPWRHPRGVWRALFGQATDGLIEQGVLKSVMLGNVPAPEIPNAGNIITAHSVEDGSYYGVSTLPEVPSRTLTTTDLDGFELDPERFRRWLRSHLGITGESLPWEVADDVLDLGIVTVGEQHIHLLYAIRRPAEGIPNRLRTLVGINRPVVLCPSLDPTKIGLATVPLGQAIVSHQDAIRRVVYATGLDSRVPAVHIAPDDARLIVDPMMGMIWVDRQLISRITPGTINFQFVKLVAEASPQALERQTIKLVVSGASADDHVVRKAQTQVNKAIQQALASLGMPMEMAPFVGAGRGMVRCRLKCFVRPT